MKKQSKKRFTSIITISLVGIISAISLGMFLISTKNDDLVVNDNISSEQTDNDNYITLNLAKELENNPLNRGLFIKNDTEIKLNRINTKQALDILIKDTIERSNKIEGFYKAYNINVKYNIIDDKTMDVFVTLFHKKNSILKYKFNFQVLIK